MNLPSIKKNFIMNSLLTISSFIFPLITFPYISRVLTAVGTGKISFATSFINYFTMFAQLGIPTYGIRICAQVRDNKTELSRVAHELLFINILTSIISYIVLFCSILLIPKLQEEKTLYILMSSTIFLSSIGMEWLYKALEQYTYITIRSLIFKIIALISMFLLVHKESDYLLYGGISIFAGCASNVLNFINAHKYISIKPTWDYHPCKHIKGVLQFFAIACATTIYTNLDTIMLGFMTSNTDVGYYNAAVKIKIILTGIITSLGAVLLPRATHYIENNRLDEFKTISNKALEFVFVIAVPMMLYFMLFAEEAILVISGDGFLGSIQPMQIIMPTLLLIGLSNLVGIQMLVPLGKQNVVLWATILGAGIDLIINAFLIPSIASSGAAIGTVVAELVVLLVMCYGIKGTHMVELKSINYKIVFVGVIVSLVFAMGIKYLRIGAFSRLALSGVLFFGSYLAVLLIGKERIVSEVIRDFKRNLRSNKEVRKQID